MSQRDTSLDSVGGLMILHMISFHLRGYLGYEVLDLENVLFFFFMPWFFFKAGMFWKMDSIKNVVVKGYCRLLKPFIIFSIIGHLCFCIRLFVERDYNWVHYVLSPFKALLRYG